MTIFFSLSGHLNLKCILLTTEYQVHKAHKLFNNIFTFEVSTSLIDVLNIFLLFTKILQYKC